MTRKVTVPYEHQERDLQTIYLAVTTRPQPAAGEWKPAYRDTVDGRRVVWARFNTAGAVWLRDRDGDRQVQPHTGQQPSAAPLLPPAPAAPQRQQPAAETDVEAPTW